MTDGEYIINDHLVIVGSKSMRVEATASPFSILTTQSFGDLSSYSGIGSGVPTSGTVGIWMYLQAGEITSATLRIGSSSGDYAEVAGIQAYTGNWSVQDGWNYIVFRLKNSSVTGTPVWTAVDYLRIQFTSLVTPTVVLDYLTIGTGDVIGLNGLGKRETTYSTATYNY